MVRLWNERDCCLRPGRRRRRAKQDTIEQRKEDRDKIIRKSLYHSYSKPSGLSVLRRWSCQMAVASSSEVKGKTRRDAAEDERVERGKGSRKAEQAEASNDGAEYI